MILEFLVDQTPHGWAVVHQDRTLSLHEREAAALQAADRQARMAHRQGWDSRVLSRSACGRVWLERSYGRHPLVAPGLEQVAA